MTSGGSLGRMKTSRTRFSLTPTLSRSTGRGSFSSKPGTRVGYLAGGVEDPIIPASRRPLTDSEITHLMPDFKTTCEDAARAGGAVLLDWAGRFAVREKGPADLVTEADFASQQVIRERLLSAFPDHGFVGEENGEDIRPEAAYRWIVDPLDGTTNYVHQLPQYSVSVALEHEGRIIAGTVFDPVADECFSAARGQGAFLNGRRLIVSRVRELPQALVAASFPACVRRDAQEIKDFIEVLLVAQAVRRMGSSALNLCYVAAGRFDAYWATETKTWDVAAGFLMIEEAGGVISNLQGAPYDLRKPRFVAAANEALQQQIIGVLGQ